MSFLREISSGVVEAVGGVADDLFTSDEERMQGEIALRKLDLEDKRIDDRQYERQSEVNLQEAKHGTWWVAGGRPYIFWVCGTSLAVMLIAWPLASLVGWANGAGIPDYPVDPSITLTLLMAMLGVGYGSRTVEKIKGVASTAISGSIIDKVSSKVNNAVRKL